VTHTAPVFWFSPVPVRIDRCLNGNFLSLAVKSTTTLVMKLQCDCSLGSSDFLMLLLQLLCRTVTCSSRLHDRGSLVLNRRRSDKNEDHTSVFSGGATALPLFVFFYMGGRRYCRYDRDWVPLALSRDWVPLALSRTTAPGLFGRARVQR
jgi:hypothetical protein